MHCDDVHALVAQIWTEVLGVTNPRPSDDFFALGGHSLAVMQVTSRLYARLGVKMPTRESFEHRTLYEYANCVAERMTQERARHT